MDILLERTEDLNKILYFSVNQDYSCIAVSTKVGFKIFSTDTIRLLYESKCGPIGIVEMLYSTNLILLVGYSDFGDFSPRRITIWSTNENCVICSSWPFTYKISLAKLNKKRMVILERNILHFYSTEDMNLLHSIEVGNVSPDRIAISPNEKNNYLCFSSSNDEGIVKIYDLLFFSFKSSFQAHKSEISHLTINNKGDMVVTSSSKGTILRIFSLPKGEKLFTFKRGISPAKILSLNFSQDNSHIISTSDTGTLHIFDLKQENEGDKSNLSGVSVVTSYFSSLFSKVTTNILPKDYEDMVGVSRSIISYNSNFLKVKNIASFTQKSNTEAFTLNYDGVFYYFTINYENQTISKICEYNLKDLRLII